MPVRAVSLPLHLTRAEIDPFLQSGPPSGENRLPARLEDLIGRSMRTVLRIAKPQGLIRVCAIRATAGAKLFLAGVPLVIAGEQTCRRFRGCDQVTLLAVTLGTEIDAYLEELKRGDLLAAYAFDSVAGAAAENAMRQLDALAVQEIRRGAYFPTARCSPGHGDWPLAHQAAFLESIAAGQIRLSATAHHLLSPAKSITAAVGWSKTPQDRGSEEPRHKACQGPNTCPGCPVQEQCSRSKAGHSQFARGVS